jgi:hypothetical protein
MNRSSGRQVRLPRVPEEMRRVAGMLGQELLRWPGVSARPMFGLRAFYRGRVVFAMLPEKRALENANAIGYKLAEWRLFELEGDDAVAGALQRLGEAYRRAG